jgi:hypothetical protein
MRLRSGVILVVGAPAIESLAFCFYMCRLKYAVIATTRKSMTAIARRKKAKVGSEITALLVLLAFAMDSQL